MTPRHKQTSLPSHNQPVRFYKFVAISFLAVTVLLFGLVVFFSSKRAIITIESVRKPVDVTGIVQVAEKSDDNLLVGVVSSTVVTAELSFEPVGMGVEPAIATGIATIHNTGSQNQTLVATTRLLSEAGVLFRMKDRATVPAGGSVVVSVYADQKGAEGNIGPTRFTIPGLSVAKQVEIYATSDEAMSGGTVTIRAFGSDDKKTAEESLKKQMLEKGKADILAANPGMIGAFSLVEDEYITTSTVGEVVDKVNISARGTVAAVLYLKKDIEQVSRALLEKRSVADVESIEPDMKEPVVTINSLDLENRRASVKVFFSGLTSLNPHSRQLERSMFFGKTADEVRRYILSLDEDHIHGVHVSFQPSWMQTVPHVADHIKIMMKDVK